MSEDAIKPWPDHAAVQAIERALWNNGHQGDNCALIAASVIEGLVEAGYRIVRSE